MSYSDGGKALGGKKEDELYELVSREGGLSHDASRADFDAAWEKIKARGFYSQKAPKRGQYRRDLKFVFGRDGAVIR